MRNGELEASTAAELLECALDADDEQARRDAINIFTDYPAAFLTPNGVVLPSAIMDGLVGQPAYVREWAVIGLGAVLAARPLKDWLKMEAYAYAVVAALALAWLEETNADLKSGCGAILSPVLKAFPGMGILSHPRREINVGSIRRELESTLIPAGHQQRLIARSLEDWAK